MKRVSQTMQAERFRELHDRPQILVLPNAWDATSARIFEQAGFEAIGTTSAGIASLFGFQDGEHISREQMISMIASITGAVDVPVSADIESGYGKTIGEVVETVHKVIAAGAVGINVEDSTHLAQPLLMDLGYQVELIHAVRQVAQDEGIPLMINARVDVYLREVGAIGRRFNEVVERARAYLQAGADSIFVIGLSDSVRIRKLVKALDCPLNILAGAGSPTIRELEELGVRRVSFGSSLMRATLPIVAEMAQVLRASGDLTKYTQHEYTHGVMDRWFEK